MGGHKVRRPLTQCGLCGHRAKVIARDGNRLTYRWPCGYERTEVFMHGAPVRKPASPDVVALFARYWSDGVTYECPRCRRAASKKAIAP